MKGIKREIRRERVEKIRAGEGRRREIREREEKRRGWKGEREKDGSKFM